MAGITGCRVLVVEDEFFLAHDLCEELAEAGAVVVGPAGSLAEALDLVTSGARVDLALLDVNLRHERVHPILSVLQRQRVPSLLLTGDPSVAEDPLLAGVPRLDKPVATERVLVRLRTLWQEDGEGGGPEQGAGPPG